MNVNSRTRCLGNQKKEKVPDGEPEPRCTAWTAAGDVSVRQRLIGHHAANSTHTHRLTVLTVLRLCFLM